MAEQKLSLAVMMSPLGLNSITACERDSAASLPASSMALIFSSVMSVAIFTTL